MGKTTRITPSLVVLLIVSWSSVAFATDGPLATNDFPYQTQLDDNYSLKWNFNSTHIIFHSKVKTQGWAGLGISNHGDMYPGDMVIGWMSGEAVHFHDRHATGRVLPEIDTQQDWHLVDFKREDGQYNTFTVVRQLNTCDDNEDLPIVRGTVRVIYAYSDAVPSSDDDILYHGHLRGSKSLLLLEPPPADSRINNIPSDATTHDFLNENYTVPRKDTTYSCIITKFPVLDGKHHLVRYEPVIQKGHEILVHHVILYYCNKEDIPENLMNKPYECYSNEPEAIGRACRFVLVAWGIGGTAFDYPAHVGHSLGTADDPVYFKLETHYDNFQLRDDFVDSSGLRVYLTKQIRQHDAGMLLVGMGVDELHAIPPKYTDFMSRAYCPSECFDSVFGDDGIKIFADTLHSHLMGKRLATRHVRDGVELPPIAKDDHYDFNYQEGRLLPEEVVVKKGDTLITDCIYDSSKRTYVTLGGLSSRQEMCISFLLYYPRTALDECKTSVLYRKQDEYMYNSADFLVTNDWSNKENREGFQKNVSESDTVNYCIYRNKRGQRITIPQPMEFVEYMEEDVCKPGGGETSSSTSMTSRHVLVLALCFVGCLLHKYTENYYY